MTEKELDKKFNAAFAKASSEEQSLVPPDLQLHLYAYYKRAIDEPYVSNRSFESNDLRNAFKMNALIQVQAISKKEAKKRYIEIIENLYPKPW
ncbi:acyl-CoA binding protein [Nonlabens dokdonensis]|jgi:acyl-CoA-binding protein|uniref:Acyl-coA-binding protein, ACBP n=2 Tax=Nonlabens dokdonensis TaxID=328515 RepID=L7W7D4_NONDD|nr:acyl-CoA-binding protein [Nonlabens dokdonensis]AGC75701.1 acyl-coA-binding protein, ACBP [Nonlabens dokdonensis DSW-6]PZX43389.1 acyl-CoA binding protein [Nonlabens dokdonensis]